jgi:hypothetical protein
VEALGQRLEGDDPAGVASLAEVHGVVAHVAPDVEEQVDAEPLQETLPTNARPPVSQLHAGANTEALYPVAQLKVQA